MKTRIIGILFISVLLIISTINALAYEVETHRTLNEEVAKQTINGFSLNLFLLNTLGFKNGVAYSINNREIYKLMGDGGVKEDLPDGMFCFRYVTRSLNHFHDPISNLGFTRTTTSSSVNWLGRPAEGQYCGNYSWNDVRKSYYTALTYGTTKERAQYWSETFRGLGQLMHLVQDASVPSHTRLDFHAYGDYEAWVLEMQGEDKGVFDGWLSDTAKYGYGKSTNTVPIGALASNAQTETLSAK